MSEGEGIIRVGTHPSLSSSPDKEIDYVHILNHTLPPDIRVLGWAPVPPDFNARYVCVFFIFYFLFH